MACNPVLSNYLINKQLLVLTNQGTFTSPATVYLALYTSIPNPNNSGTEVSGTAYVRQAITWAAVGSGQTTNNSVTITFPAAGSNWGTVTYLALFDASTSGNLLMFAPATTSIAVNTGNVYQVNTGQLVMSMQ